MFARAYPLESDRLTSERGFGFDAPGARPWLPVIKRDSSFKSIATTPNVVAEPKITDAMAIDVMRRPTSGATPGATKVEPTMFHAVLKTMPSPPRATATVASEIAHAAPVILAGRTTTAVASPVS
jgi:hypothetical protein